MAKFFEMIETAHASFIADQHVFFVGTAAETGRVNVSPKGMDALRVLGPNRIVWRNLTGSGNETAGHLGQVNRMTLMWCSFEKRPMILRCYGTARTIHPRDNDWDSLNAHFEPAIHARNIFDVSVEQVQSSCGYSIPFMDFVGERDTLDQWAASKGEDGIRTHWAESNQQTIDGFPTGMTEPLT